jgi:hypothetical protein
MENNNLKASDHKALIVEVDSPREETTHSIDISLEKKKRWDELRLQKRDEIRQQVRMRRILLGCSLAVGAFIFAKLRS